MARKLFLCTFILLMAMVLPGLAVGEQPTDTAQTRNAGTSAGKSARKTGKGAHSGKKRKAEGIRE